MNIERQRDTHSRVFAKLTILIFGLLLTIPTQGQQLTVQYPSAVYEGDNFTVRFVLDAQTRDFEGPTFKGFSLRSGPNKSTSTSMSIINGQMTHSVQTTFSYILTAEGEGNYTIGPASCTVDGKKTSSRSFTIKVQKADPNRKQQQSSGWQQSTTYDLTNGESPTIDKNSLFARATVSNSHPYQGEQVIVTYKIYTQIPISQFGIDKLPGNRGFWAEDLSEGSKIKQYEETIDGRRYQVAEIRRGALFAQQSGQLAIEPLQLNVLAMVQRQRRRTGSIWDLFDDPFFNTSQAVERPLQTNRITLNVKPLPAAPDDFTGGVGRFDIEGGLSLREVKANEAVSYRITISGNGNLMLINAPKPEFPNTFEVYDPQVDDKLRRGENGIGGSRTFEWVIIPRSQGKYTIPALHFVYFDPQAGRYITKTIEEQEIEVMKGDAASVAASGSNKDDVRLLAQDINYMHPVGRLQQVRTRDRIGFVYWIAMLTVVALGAGALILIRRHHIAEQDTVGTARRRATRLARRRLSRAEKHLHAGNEKDFYEEIYKAIWGCLSDKYSIPLGQLNRETVQSCLNDKQIPIDLQQRIMKLIQDVDFARFAPGDARGQMQTIYDEALETIVAL